MQKSSVTTKISHETGMLHSVIDLIISKWVNKNINEDIRFHIYLRKL